MSEPGVSLLMAIHCHQPVGNFGFVFEEAFQKAYEPFLQSLERHPSIQISLHYSGSLLDWLTANRPAFLTRLTALVRKGQVELLASGYYEPILPLIPEPDRQGQIALMRRTLQRLFGASASGLWLTERVWEPELPQTLARAGIRYTMVDTNQFGVAQHVLPGACQHQDEDGLELLGCYATEYAGSSVVVFPSSKRLRYGLPFHEVDRTITWMKRLVRAEPLALSFADDGEKFGLWPKTYDWVYERGWLDRFFSALERESSWLITSTFSRYLNTVGPSGRVYLPSGSYEEMLEWSRGHFRNFFVKYPEANAMYHKMLDVSQRLSECTVNSVRLTGKTLPKWNEHLVHRTPLTVNRVLKLARKHLYMAQCNCAYWHGVFGGLYLAHLRGAVYRHLITAERLLREAGRRLPPVEIRDVDGDGLEDVILRNRAVSAVFDPAEDGSMTELAHYGSAVNLTDTLARRYEPYHEKLAAQGTSSGQVRQAPASIHELAQVKQEGLERVLAYDDHRRASFIDYALSAMPTLSQVVQATWGEYRLWAGGRWTVHRPRSQRTVPASSVTFHRPIHGGHLQKTVTIFRDQPRLSFRYQVTDLVIPVIGLEINLGLRDEQRLAPRQQDSVGEVQIVDCGAGLTLTMRLREPARLITFPIETVSESEEGLERTLQGLALVWLWSTNQASRWSCELNWTIGDADDR